MNETNTEGVPERQSHTPKPAEFKVGQKWKCRNGKVAEITELEGQGSSYPVVALIDGEKHWYNTHGLHWNRARRMLDPGAGFDLVELIEGEPSPAQIDMNELAAETLQSLGWHFVGNCWVQDAQPEVQTPKSDEPWKKHARELVRWRTSMSYNDSYFGEPAGLLKHVVRELELLIDGNPKVAESNSHEKDELPSNPENHPLYPIFIEAIAQAMFGKGERHGGAVTPFIEQPWVHYAKMHGRGFLTGQAAKKLEEAASKRTGDAFVTEVLGAMVYAGMAVIYERGEVK